MRLRARSGRPGFFFASAWSRTRKGAGVLRTAAARARSAREGSASMRARRDPDGPPYEIASQVRAAWLLFCRRMVSNPKGRGISPQSRCSTAQTPGENSSLHVFAGQRLKSAREAWRAKGRVVKNQKCGTPSTAKRREIVNCFEFPPKTRKQPKTDRLPRFLSMPSSFCNGNLMLNSA